VTRARLQIDFAPDAGAGRRAVLAWLLPSVLLLALCLLAVLRSLAGNAEQARLLAQWNTAPAARSPTTTPARHDPAELARIQFVRRTARNMATPWSDLLASLEATPANVALLAVQPTAASRSVSLTAEAASPADMLAWLRHLQADPRLNSVVLVSHQLQAQSPGTPLRFQVEGHWGETP
jgi:Tfp pilus assembly protein PilN